MFNSYPTSLTGDFTLPCENKRSNTIQKMSQKSHAIKKSTNFQLISVNLAYVSIISQLCNACTVASASHAIHWHL